MATIKRYQTAAGELWEVRYRQPNGITTRKRGFATKKAAEDWDADNRSKMNRGEFVSPSKGRTKVGDLAQPWLDQEEGHDRAEHTAGCWTRAWRVHVSNRAWADGAGEQGVGHRESKNWSASMTGRGPLRLDGAAGAGRPGGHPGRRDCGWPDLKESVPAAWTRRNGRSRPSRSRKHVYLGHDAVARLADESAAAPDPGARRWPTPGCAGARLVALRVRHVDEVRRRLVVTDNAVQLGADDAVGDPGRATSRARCRCRGSCWPS